MSLGASATVWSLGRKWQLQDWEDWQMFARYGIRGMIEPLGIRQKLEALVPSFMKSEALPAVDGFMAREFRRVRRIDVRLRRRLMLRRRPANAR